jgi:tRNA threonylcarbamoyladenosine biosynthesis protein TsaB
MRVLALDTTARAGSVALVERDRTIEERAGDAGRTHAERLPGELLELLGRHGLQPRDVDLFAVACGPGSFTGLRVGLATMQGLALVVGRGLIGVSALDALAELGSRDRAPGTRVAAWVDAHRREVFAALYEVTAAPLFSGDRLAPIEEPTVGPPADVLRRHGPIDVVIGDGAVLYADLVERVAPQVEVVAAPPIAGAIGRLAIVRSSRGGPVDPAAVHPLYVRRPDAEIARDRAQPRR